MLLAGCVTPGADDGAKGKAAAEARLGERIPDVPAAAREACPRPSIGDRESPWAALGRTGGDLIRCEGRRAAAVAHADRVKREFSAK